MNSQTTFAQALLNPDLPCPGGLTSWNGSDPAQRFAVYRNNVMVSLIDALADSYPGLQELVGEGCRHQRQYVAAGISCVGRGH